jgi:hypothetical protein
MQALDVIIEQSYENACNPRGGQPRAYESRNRERQIHSAKSTLGRGARRRCAPKARP